MTQPARRRPDPLLLVCALAVTLVLGALVPAGAEHSSAARETTVHLVTLEGPGVAGYRGPLTRATFRELLVDSQDDVLEQLGDVEPVYRWTDALNGFAAELSPAEVTLLRADRRVALVEENTVRQLASTAWTPSRRGLVPLSSRGGAGAVLGVVDTGLAFESPVFAPTPALGRPPQHFRGGCAGPDDPATSPCNGKVVGARWFVHGFGADNLRSPSSLSAADDHGHGTQVASIAAGNAEVPVEVPGQSLGTYGGVAPQARIAVYKACWTAPDPAYDGCATADLVSAVDRATRDRVDVLNLSVGGPAEIDTVERALLGAAERGIVVVGAAGNRGTDGFAAHPSPWVTTVGAVTGQQHRGQVEVAGRRLPGAMVAGAAVGPARLVLAERVPAPGTTPSASRECRPGSLDAARTRGAVVLCERGGLARVAKAAAVANADGVGMVLANSRPGEVASDLHRVPTVHVRAATGRWLRRWADQHPRGQVTLTPLGVHSPPAVVTRWSSGGDPSGPIVKPDVVAPATGLLGAVPPTVRGTPWDFASGTSVAAAWTSGLALRLRGQHDWSADEVRSALVTTAGPVAGGPFTPRAGAGRPRPEQVGDPVLAFRTRPGDYRAWLRGSLRTARLNTPALQLADHHETTAVRRVTNVGPRTATFTAGVSGFEEHQVGVHPAVLRLAPGESATFRVRVSGQHEVSPADDGSITWRRSDGATARVPVVLGR